MLKLSDKALRQMLTPERLLSLGLTQLSQDITNEELTKFLTPERLAELGLRHKHAKDDEHLDVPLIEFICEPNHMDVIPKPYPAFKNMPQWFRDLELYVPRDMHRDHFGGVPMTAKHCLPMLDAQSMGYIMPLYADMNVRTNHDGKRVHITHPRNEPVGSTHDAHQVGGEGGVTGGRPAVKFHNPWVIKTRPGWSTLFVPPINLFEEKRFTCLAAMVDTDTYPKQVNFPAVWHMDDYDDIVKAGTPLVVAIPVRRKDVERWATTRVMTEAERLEIGRIERTQNMRTGYYTKELRDPVRGEKK